MPGQNLLLVEPFALPLLPLRDVVVFPHMVIPLFVGRVRSIKSLEEAMLKGRRVMLVAQKSAVQDQPDIQDLYGVGCIATILQLLKLPDGTVKVLVEGQQRAQILEIHNQETSSWVTVSPLNPESPHASGELEALRRALVQQFDQFVKLNKKIPSEILGSIASIDAPARLADTVTAHMPFKLEDKQEVLALLDVRERMEHLLGKLEGEVEILNVDRRIRGRVKKQMEKNQRDFYLNEQVKAIQKELGEGDESVDIAQIEKRVLDAGMSEEAQKKVAGEIRKLKLMSPMSAEASVVRNYIDSVVGLPWNKKSRIKKNLAEAEAILQADHWGLEKVKERILEYLAVQQRVGKVKAPILCLVGPPGVGKTSLGQSIAKATGRKYVRMALGGVRDEAEIRGHRRTYIGSMPGKILSNLSRVESRNPLFLLDEIDKMGSDFRGDPASALLEVLDPEQNHTFNDHYVEVDFDLSEVMFVATSNSMNIPAPLLDRMEVIRLSGYTEDEKLNIATRYLVPKQMEANGVREGELLITEGALRDVVRYYTREAGVRSLEREISRICRKVVKASLVKKSRSKSQVDAEDLGEFLGVRKFTFGLADRENKIGQVTGLAWTETGGDLLTIEAAVMPGKGNIIRTGSLGDVMKESVEAARTVVRSRAAGLGISSDDFEKKDLHIHVPDGATPKDGPSAGVAMTVALVSTLAGIPVRSDVAMTGEITLRGEITAIGGLKEKLLAALRGGSRTVLIPQENAKDLAEVPSNVKNGLEIMFVKWIDEALQIALERMPIPLDTALPSSSDVGLAPASKTSRSRSKTVVKH